MFEEQTTVEPQLSNDSLKLNNSDFDQKSWVKDSSEFEHTNQVDENGIHMNEYQGKPNMAEQLAESTRAAFFQFSNIILEWIISDNRSFTVFQKLMVRNLSWDKVKYLFTQLCHEQDVKTRSILKYTVLNFPSPRLVALVKLKNTVCPTIYP